MLCSVLHTHRTRRGVFRCQTSCQSYANATMCDWNKLKGHTWPANQCWIFELVKTWLWLGSVLEWDLVGDAGQKGPFSLSLCDYHCAAMCYSSSESKHCRYEQHTKSSSSVIGWIVGKLFLWATCYGFKASAQSWPTIGVITHNTWKTNQHLFMMILFGLVKAHVYIACCLLQSHTVPHTVAGLSHALTVLFTLL